MKAPFDLRQTAAHFGQQTALILGSSHVLSYRDVWHAAEAMAAHLVSFGVTSTTPWVAIEPARDVQSVLMVWTLVSLGQPFLVLHPAWSAAQKVAALEQTGAPLVPITALPLEPALDTRFGAPSRAYELLERTTDAEDALCLVYTSGTTGQPKGAILSRRAFIASANEACDWLQIHPNDRWLLSLPLAHVGGLSVLMRTWLRHASVIIPPANSSSFDAHDFSRVCQETNATLVSLVPTQLQRLCSQALPAPPHLRCALLGGAPTPLALVAQATELGFRVARTYGLTELCSIVASDAPRAEALRATIPSTDELPLHTHVQARISEDGRLMLRGASLFSGYWGQPQLTARDWFTTEDLAELEDGRLRILGRADDAIVTGGEKVHPVIVEAALLACMGIEQACVFARPSPEWGQEVCAALVTTPGFSLAEAVSRLRESLPSFNIPRAWVCVSRLPTNPNGKVHRLSAARELGPLCHPIQL